MTSTLETCANTAARPASPSEGDTLYQEDTNQIIVCSNETGPVWKTYESNGELAYPNGIYTQGTPYSITTQPDMHYDASRINGADESGNPALGGAVSSWQDRSGNSRDADQATAADQGYYQEMGGNSGIKMPSSDSLGFYDTNHAFASGSDGMTVIAVVTPPAYSYYTQIVNAAAGTSATPRFWNSAGIGMNGWTAATLNNLGGSYSASSYTKVNSQVPRIITVLDGDGDQKLFEGRQVGFAGTTARTQINIDNYLQGAWFLGEGGTGGSTHFGKDYTKAGGGIYYEVIIFRGLLGYTVDGNGDLNGGEMNTVVTYLANKYGIDADTVYVN